MDYRWASRSTTSAQPEVWKPPYHGPPPMPSNIGVSASQWSSGYWSFNPAYASRPPAPSSSSQPSAQQPYWLPGRAWHTSSGQQQQQPQQQQQQNASSYNPYKRHPRAPSAEYMATKLVDNPLGLTNMVPRDQVYQGTPDGSHHTPWIWNPRALKDEDDPESGIITADYKDASGRRFASEPRLEVRNPSRQSSLDTPDSSRQPSEQPSRKVSFDSRLSSDPSHQNVSYQQPHQSTPTREPFPQRHSSAEATSSSQRSSREHTPSRHHSAPSAEFADSQHLQRHLNLSPQHTGAPTTPPRSTGEQHAPSARHGLNDSPLSSSLAPTSELNESFTSRVELQPTFSPKIVRTPNHYRSLEHSSRTSTPIATPSAAYATTNGQSMISRMENLDLSNFSQGSASKSSRRQSLPAASFPGANFDSATSKYDSISDVTNFTDEPFSSTTTPLSPMWPAMEQTQTRKLGRGGSVPQIPNNSSLSSIPEAQPIQRESSVCQISPRSSQHHTQSSPRYHSSTSHRLSADTGTISNPLPLPPQEIRTSLTSPFPREPTPPEGTYTHRVRKGFWNRRGDHLTLTGHVVYAPNHLKYPGELQDYPKPGEGFMDEMGSVVEHRRDRPELPESLPRHGHSPEVPYSAFVVYRYS